MGDFEDIFGAGADAADIVEGFASSYNQSSQRDKDNWYESLTRRSISEPETQKEEEALWWKPPPGGILTRGFRTEIDEWKADMLSKGYVQGPYFKSYEAMDAWSQKITRPYVRRPIYSGYGVFYTDGLTIEEFCNQLPVKRSPRKILRLKPSR